MSYSCYLVDILFCLYLLFYLYFIVLIPIIIMLYGICSLLINMLSKIYALQSLVILRYIL